MSRRITNLLLLLFLTAAFVTGWVAFGIGTGWVRLPVILHSIFGLAIIVLIPWKSMIVAAGLGRNRAGTATSLALLLLVSITIASGVLFSAAGVRNYGPLTAIQIHVGGAFGALALAVVHTWQRPVRPTLVDLERRNLLRAGGVIGAAGLAYLAVEGATRLFQLPGRKRRTTGSFERGSYDPVAMPVTQWLSDSAPSLRAAEWRLRVRLPDRTAQYHLDELDAYTDQVTAILDCTGGWYSEQEWAGVGLDRLLEGAEGASIVVTSATGYQRRFPMADAEHLLVATRLGDQPLSRGHGYPARLVAPGRRGFWWVKWVESIEVSDRSWWLQPPFPLT